MTEPSSSVRAPVASVAVLVGFEPDGRDSVYSHSVGGRSVIDHAVDVAVEHVARVVMIGDVNARRIPTLHVERGAPLVDALGEALDAEPADAFVVVHELVWAMVDRATWKRAVGAAGDMPVLPMVHVTDTVRDRAGALVDRAELMQCQSPRVYRRSRLDALMAGGDADDLAAVAHWGGEVTMVEGDRAARPIVHPRDLAVASKRISP